jgi:hypothetical protein
MQNALPRRRRRRGTEQEDVFLRQAFLRQYRGRVVRLEWRRPQDTWHFFRVLGLRGRRVKLKGVFDPEIACRHAGDEFWCSISGIRQWAYSGEWNSASGASHLSA